MPKLRDHAPITIDEFNGWWDRGEDETCPIDHFSLADNIQYYEHGFETRYPIQKYQSGLSQLTNVVRVYNYTTQTGHTLLALCLGGTNGANGIIYHVTNLLSGANVAILTIAGMTDFGFVAIAGRAYITPFAKYPSSFGQPYELGLKNEFLYVYNGDGTPARKAGGTKPTNSGAKPFLAYNDINDGVVTAGLHFIAISYDGTNFGPLSPSAVYLLPSVLAPGNKKIKLDNLPIPPPGTGFRKIVMTKAIDATSYYTGPANLWYEVETITDNTLTTKIIDKSDDQLTVLFTPPGAGFTSNAIFPIGTNNAGFCDFGFHLVGVVYETNSGYMTAPGPVDFGGNSYFLTTKSVLVVNIPKSSDPNVVKRHLVSTKAIPFYNGDNKGYQFFFIPKGTITDNLVTQFEVSYYDSDLLSDASHLLDNFEQIPSGVALTTYHSRLVLVGDSTIPDPVTSRLSRSPRSAAARPDNRSVAWVSAPGEPEAISKVDGLIVTPLDGNPLTNCMEFRDILHLYKETRTYGYSDNNDVPSSWQEEVIDLGIGAPVHGVATVLDTGGVNADFLLIADHSGLVLFNGVYSRPELSWKIEDYWLIMHQLSQVVGQGALQIVNDTVGKKIYITLPAPFQYFVLHADYRNGLDAKNIKWSRWVFDAKMTSVCLFDMSTLILGAGFLGI